MKIRVLGSSGSEGPGHNPSAFLVDDFLLMDAGTVSLSLDRDAQCRVTHILLTHAHLDHIKAIPFLVDNIVASNQGCRLTILSGRDVISDLKRNIFNNRIWPDFTLIPDSTSPVMQFQEIIQRDRLEIGNYRVYATRVDHAVPAYGYMIEDASGDGIIYTGDTGPTHRIWKRMRGHRIKALIIEVSFPDEMLDLAQKSGHMTPSLLEQEIHKMDVVPDRIYITHLKPYHKKAINEELKRLERFHVEVLEDGREFTV
jgi:ribonuclease BN (tRNA processing enzyme)